MHQYDNYVAAGLVVSTFVALGWLFGQMTRDLKQGLDKIADKIVDSGAAPPEPIEPFIEVHGSRFLLSDVVGTRVDESMHLVVLLRGGHSIYLDHNDADNVARMLRKRGVILTNGTRVHGS